MRSSVFSVTSRSQPSWSHKTAKATKRFVLPDTESAIGSCGQILYYSELEPVGLKRLTDHHLARNKLDYSYLERRGVQFVLSGVGKDGKPAGGSSDHQIKTDVDFHGNFASTDPFWGVNQHGPTIIFAMFSYRDCSKSPPSPDDLAEKADLARLLERSNIEWLRLNQKPIQGSLGE